MSDDSFDINHLLSQWFEDGDEAAYDAVYAELRRQLRVTQDVERALGSAVADEVRQEVLMRLLDREARRLWGRREPVAYAWVAWRRSLVSLIRRWAPRHAKAERIRQHVSEVFERDDHAQVEAILDAERAIEIAASLNSRGRLAVLLTVRPDRITDDDWRCLIESHPPPPPSRPSGAVDREAACDLMYPPRVGESAQQRYQRLNNFDQSYKRAIAQIRSNMESNL